jgi:hypothetical protein
VVLIRKDIRYRADPLACIRKYFTTASVLEEFPENRGRKPNKESSKPTQTKNQLLLLIITKFEKTINKK